MVQRSAEPGVDRVDTIITMAGFLKIARLKQRKDGKSMKQTMDDLSKCFETLKDYGKFKHIFSDDDGVRTLAKIRELVGQILLRVRISEIKEIRPPGTKALRQVRESGKFVAVRPCSKEFEGKTFLGMYIGDVALGSSVRIEEDAIVCEWTSHNPAILIPESGAIVYGAGSWWKQIRTEEDLKSISDLDIENTWYVKALNQIPEEE